MLKTSTMYIESNSWVRFLPARKLQVAKHRWHELPKGVAWLFDDCRCYLSRCRLTWFLAFVFPACMWIICWLKVPQDFNSGLLKWRLKTKKLCNMRVAHEFDLPLIYTPWTGGRLMKSIGVIGGNPYKLFWNQRLLHMPLQPTWRNLNISEYYKSYVPLCCCHFLG